MEPETAATRILRSLFTLPLLGVFFVAALIGAERTPGISDGSNGPGGTTTRPLSDFLKAVYSDDNPPAVASNRLIVILRTSITDDMLTDLSRYGVVHGWIDRYSLVAMSPQGDTRGTIEALPYVDHVETDGLVYPSDVGTWDRDIIDIVNVEESGSIGDPDPREVLETGAGVHVAVLDTGLVPGWRNFLPESRVDTSLARAFVGGEADGTAVPPQNEFNRPTGLWEQDTCAHGTAVASEVTGFRFGQSMMDGVAPGATIIPLKAFFFNGLGCSAFHSQIIAGIDYVTRLVETGTIGRTVINMSFGGDAPSPLLERAINDAIAAGIVAVGVAGNSGERGMSWPGAFPQVISLGATGWTRQFRPGTVDDLNLDFWWQQDVGFDPDPRRGPSEESETFVAAISGRALPQAGQELDLLAPGWGIMAPLPRADLQATGDFFLLIGTSFAAPSAAGVAALMLEKNPTLDQAQIEAILKSTALPMSRVDTRTGVLDVFAVRSGNELLYLATAERNISWDDDCAGLPCDPVGAGLLQADAAIAGVPKPAHRITGSLATDESAAVATPAAEGQGTPCGSKVCRGNQICCSCVGWYGTSYHCASQQKGCGTCGA